MSVPRCLGCGLAIDEHEVHFAEAASADRIEGKFPDLPEAKGFYCPRETTRAGLCLACMERTTVSRVGVCSSCLKLAEICGGEPG